MIKHFLSILFLMICSSLLAQESVWELQVEAGLGAVKYEYQRLEDSRSGAFYSEDKFWIPAVHLGTEIRYKSFGFNIDSYNFGLFPGVSCRLINKNSIQKVFLTYKLTNLQAIGIGTFDKKYLRHGPGLKVQLNRFNFNVAYTFDPPKEIELKDDSEYINSFRFNISYTFLRCPFVKE